MIYASKTVGSTEWYGYVTEISIRRFFFLGHITQNTVKQFFFNVSSKETEKARPMKFLQTLGNK